MTANKKLVNSIWYFSMALYDAGMAAVNHINKDVENLFASTSDYRMFLRNLSFRVIYFYIKTF